MRTRWIRLICLWDFGGISGEISIVHNESDAAEVYTQVSRSSVERIRRVLEESNAIRRDEYWYVDWSYLPEDDEDHPDNVMARRASARRPEEALPQYNSGGYVTPQWVPIPAPTHFVGIDSLHQGYVSYEQYAASASTLFGLRLDDNE